MAFTMDNKIFYYLYNCCSKYVLQMTAPVNEKIGKLERVREGGGKRLTFIMPTQRPWCLTILSVPMISVQLSV